MEFSPANCLFNRTRTGVVILGTIILSSGLIPAAEAPTRPTQEPAPASDVPPIIMEPEPGADNSVEPAVEVDPLAPIPAEPMVPTAEPVPDNLPVLIDPASRLEAHPSTPARPGPPLRPLPGAGPIEDEEIPIEGGVYDLSARPDPGLLQLPDLSYYSVQDPLARTILGNARGLSDTLYDGVGGVPRPLNFPFLPKLAFPGDRAFHLGPVVYTPSIGAEVVFSRTDERRGGQDLNRARGNLNASVFGGIGDPDLGRFVTVDYTAAQTIGLTRGADDHFDQQLFAVGSLEFVKLRLGIGLEIESLSGYSRDLGGVVKRDYMTVALTSTYQITPKTSFDWDVTTPNGRLPGGGAGGGAHGDTSGFTSTNFINYEITPKSHLGLGFSMGLIDVDGGDTQSYQQVLIRHGSSPTPFLSYSANVGVEFRDTGGLYRTHPVFVLGAIWTPRPRTTVKISGEQRTAASAGITHSNYVTTTFAVSMRQLLGERSAVYLSAAFENAKYESTRPGESVDRRDRAIFGQVAFSTKLAERWDLALTLSATRTESQKSATVFSQVALQAWFQF